MTASAPLADVEDAQTSGSTQSRLILMTVFLAFMGQMMLNPIIAPLSRSMGLREWHIGAAVSLAALTLASLSQFWGRRSQKSGVRVVLTTSMTVGAVALASFAGLAWLGVRGIWTGTGLALGVILTRGILYGSGISAILPTAQTYFVTRARSENERVKLLGATGAAQGLATILGAVLGGALATVGGLLLPVTVMPLLMVCAIAVVLVALKPEKPTALIDRPATISYTDPRVLPFLLTGFMMFLSFAALQTLLGFAVQDRFGLSDSGTAGLTSAVMVAMSVSMVITQGVVVPRLGWSSRRLLRTGLVVLVVATACLLPTASYVLLVAGCVLTGLGLGMAIPGYNTGPTLEMSKEEQGSVAGLINANNGVTYAIAPIASTAAYGWDPAAPFVGILALMGTAAVFSLLHPALRVRRQA
ncbi:MULTISPECIES: MFS transporter [Actinomyces]|uniref:MFS transporter n=1 Tax=Actinomyces respiraculi TaxID=2744574 RepID=A0A7T0LLK6_9ACTO|nr:MULTISPECIES: MFS transporter [Actinomyces]QPL05388.1 MFS transporter [Actinomyces respiraculi]